MPINKWQEGQMSTSYQDEQAALRVMQEHRSDVFRNTFKGTKLTKTSKALKSDAESVGTEIRNFGESVAKASGASIPALPSNEAIHAVLKIIGIEEGEVEDFVGIMGEELAVLLGKSLISVATIFVPYMSTVLAGKDMVREWVLTATKYHQHFTHKRNIKTNILPGSPQEAANAVNKLIARSGAKHGTRAAINTVKFAVDVGTSYGAPGVAGPATAAAAAGAKLSQTLFLLGRDYYEMKSANEVLCGGVPFGPAELFSAYPLLGCYLIISADDSDLLFFLLPDMGGAGGMDKVEKQKKVTLGPLQKTARHEIGKSRFELAGFSGVKMAIVASPVSRLAHIKKAFRRTFGV
jgi:hypothetical protein